MNPLFWEYFKHPFPKAEGFSAYRMPGVAVHLPVLLVFAWIGWWVASAGGLLVWLLPLYVLLGLYVGRDLAILAHYIPLSTIVVWIATAALFSGGLPPPMGELGGAALTITIVVVFGFYLRWRIGREDQDEALLATGANIKYRPENRSPPYRGSLGEAVYFSRWELIPGLIEQGAQVDGDEPWLRSAARSDDPLALKAVQCLIDAGVAVDDENLLYDAATPEMQQLLLTNGARIRPESTFKSSQFLNHRGYRFERLRLLMAQGCNLAAADAYGETFLHALTRNCEDAQTLPELWPLLKDSGIDPNAVNTDGATALHLLVNSVLPYVTGRNIVGLTHKLPVDDAVRLLDILLAAGADPRLKNAAGEDAIAISRRLKAPKAFQRRLEAVPA